MFQKEEKPPEFIELKEDKRMKKLVTIVLVIAVLSSMLALPAAASQVEPRYLVSACEHCRELCRVRTRVLYKRNVSEAICSLGGTGVHNHVHEKCDDYIICSTCGESILHTYINVYHGDVLVDKRDF